MNIIEKIKAYYALSKPGIIYGNDITALAGFLLASKGHINFSLLVATLLGISLIIASSCVCNNYIDRDIDKKMNRTHKRALVTGVISHHAALIYATILGVIGIYILAVYTNIVTVIVGLVGMVFYILLYGIAKRRFVYGTLVGSVSGAMPIVGGYTAVTQRLDIGALVLFLILCFWQMPHFYAIGIYRLIDYTNAKLPILPVKEGIQVTKVHMLLYCIGFALCSILLTLFGYTGYIYFFVMLFVSLYWVFVAIQGFRVKDTTRWARKMFFISLVLILVFSAMLAFDPKR